MSKAGFLKNPFWVLGCLFLITALFLVFTVDVTATNEAGVREKLPENLGTQWHGEDVLFCQTPSCTRSWLTRDVPLNEDGIRVCPENWQHEPCGGELLTMALGERLVLPKDTVILKKQYIKQSDPENTVFTSVVLSGKDRSSIHRPEVCLDAQGNIIKDSITISIPLENGNTLKAQVLLINKTYSEEYTRYGYYAYFFVGKDRTTHLHIERLLWMSLDRIFRNVSHRWAYISVSGERNPDNTDYVEEIRDVVSKLYPQISLIESQP
ncbi:exosortase-associated EpsI family protein [Kiritimatiellota bacterium B12222]|nr:exosortase-associated EpsI family protein [Kiritimatiellota bacterium B12222]